MNQRVLALGATLLGLLGCVQPQTRLQAPDEEREVEVQTVGDLTSFSNAEPIPVSGVGIVVGLEGTGGDAPPGSYRTFLEDQLRKRGVEHVKEILTSPNNAMVLVSALIPPGAHKHDPLDIEVIRPPKSKATSLRGGYLKECFLFNYDSTRNLDPNYGGADRLLMGHKLVRAEGPVLVGLGGGEAESLVKGQVWGGGQVQIDRPLYLILNKDKQTGPIVQQVAQRINETFHGPFRGATSTVATAKTTTYLILQVPLQYRYNLARYMRVVRLIPIESATPNSPYQRQLEKDLLDPARTVPAALRLEALGNESVPALKRGLQSEHALVRFTAAEALAYLGDPSSGQELAALVERQPLVRSFSLTALASLDEAVSHVKLRELLALPDAETRYGAFRALRALDEHDPAIQGEMLNESFWLHRTAAGSEPLVHLSTSRRAEVVLFGKDSVLAPPFSFRAGEFTITSAREDTRCTISRLSVHQGVRRHQCSLNLEDVLRTLADLGGTYAEVVDFLRQAGTYQCLNCPVAVDALPQATSVHDLARDGAKNPNLLKSDAGILKERDVLGPTPALFEKSPIGTGKAVSKAGAGDSSTKSVE